MSSDRETIPMGVSHHFYPLSLDLPTYTENTLEVWGLLVRFGVLVVGVVVVGRGVLGVVGGRGRGRKEGVMSVEGGGGKGGEGEELGLGWGEEGLMGWFLLCGFLHIFFEGYFVLNHKDMPLKQDLFGQLWKEYALSDSRYMTADPLVLCMETLTAIIWGPLSLVTAYLISTSSPYRHPVQALVSAGHLYGCLLYYTTVFAEESYNGISYCRPEPYYFYGYFLAFNAPWLVVPCLCLWSSFRKSAEAFSIARSVGVEGRERGKLKKNL